MELPDKIRTYIANGGKSLLDGYLRFLDEASGKKFESIAQKLSDWQGGIPFAVTAFGDLLVWDGEYIIMYRFADAAVVVILSGDTFFFENLQDKEYQKDFFDLPLYAAAKEKYGALADDESFTFVPVPALGGVKDVGHIEKGKTFEYLSLMLS